MLRYLKLYWYFFRFSLSKTLQFRANFFFRIGMDIFFYAFNFAFFDILFHHTPLIGGWDYSQMIIFIGTYLSIDALMMTFFANNFWYLPIFVNQGDLDYYLTKPVSSLFFVTCRDIAVPSIVNAAMAIGILIWGMLQYEGPISFMQVIWFTVLVLNGLLLTVTMRLLFIIPVFWLHSNRGLDEIFWGMSVISERPDRIFFGAGRIFVTFVLPFAVIASFPARIVIEGIDWIIIVHALGLGALFLGAVQLFWNIGLRHYSSASS